MNGTFEAAVRKTCIPKRYIKGELRLHDRNGKQCWLVTSHDPTSGQSPRKMILTEDGDLLELNKESDECESRSGTR